MFTKNSRYYGLATVTAKDRSRRSVQAVKLRRLPATAGEPVVVRQGDQLDVLCQQRYRDPTRFWHIGDANSDLEANALVGTPGRTIKVPKV